MPRPKAKRQTWVRELTITLGVVLAFALCLEFQRGSMSATPLRAGTEPSDEAGEDPPVPEAAPAGSEGVRLAFFNATWDEVLEHVAEQSGLTLVMDRVPPGRITRADQHWYTPVEACRILNRELHPMGLRLLQKGRFLILLEEDAVRAEYRRPALPAAPAESLPATPRSTQTESRHAKLERGVHTITSRKHGISDGWKEAPPARQAGGTATPRGAIVPAGHAVEDAAFSEEGPAANTAPSGPVTSVNQKLHRQAATEIARTIYEAFKPRAELIDDGPQGLPAFRVYGSALARAVVAPGSKARAEQAGVKTDPEFTIGIDTESDELIIEAPAPRERQLAELVRELDFAAGNRGAAVRLLATDHDVRKIADKLEPTLTRLAQAAPQPMPNQPPRDVEPPPEPMPRPMGQQGPAEADQPGNGIRRRLQIEALREGLRGDVSVEALEDLGVLILRGNEKDVEAVMEVVRTLEQLSQGTTPDIHLLLLNNVDSAALSELLNTVYDQLATLRTREGAKRQLVYVVPVVKPNAIIVLAPEVDMPSILKLAEELDQPVDPLSEFQVFSLRHAVATQVVTTIEEFYADRPPLGTRVTATADVRTNSVIVQARPRDLAEVATLVKRIDRADSRAVSRVRIFALRNAIATEMADVVNSAIQSVLTPAPPPGATGQFGAGVGTAATGQAAQQLRDAKSAVLEFLAVEGESLRTIRSGILADIRITADPRTNNLVVTAPEESMPLMEELIRALDQPSSTVAEIKVFTLSNSDATATAALLRSLFDAQAAAQQGLQGQQGLGIQIAGAEDASSGLVPLRFSTDVRTNSVIAIGGADALRVVEAIILRLDESDIRQRQNTVVKLKNSPAIEVANAINQFLQSQRELAQVDPNLISNVELLEREIIVVPELVSNSLLISATPRYYEEILTLVAQLDQAPPQVIIQALIVEVELQNTDEFGVELGFQDSILFDRSVVNNLVTLTETITAPNGVQTTSQRVVSQESTPGFLFNNQQLGNNTAVNPSSIGTQGLSNFSLGRVNGDLGFGGLVLSASSESVSVLIRALAAKRKVHILSRPQIRTLDNQLAQIQVGQQVPVVRGVTVNTVGGASPNVQPEDVGIILSVTPRISPDGTIVMETIATKSAVSPVGVPIFTDVTSGQVVESPIIDISTARATVMVPNGQTIVLGGMITKSDDSIERKVPWLGDIPIVGLAFRYDSVSTRRTELLIFLTPRVIRHDEDNELIKRVEAERVHFIEREAEEIHGPLYAVPPVPWMQVDPNCPPGGLPGSFDATPIEVPPAPAPAPVPGTVDGPVLEEASVPTTSVPGPLMVEPVAPLQTSEVSNRVVDPSQPVSGEPEFEPSGRAVLNEPASGGPAPTTVMPAPAPQKPKAPRKFRLLGPNVK